MFFVVGICFVWMATAVHLPLCSTDGDSYGRWVSLQSYENDTSLQHEISTKFVLGGPGEALNFSRIWLPHNCSMHRFTKTSIHAVVERLIRTNKVQTPYRIITLGDSAVRGVICGVMRILSGSEVFGPLENEICGDMHTEPVSILNIHEIRNAFFGTNIEMSFMYMKSLSVQYSRWMVEGNMGKKPAALILNTGAWDFDELARKHRDAPAPPECQSDEYDQVSQLRVQPSIAAELKECGEIAKRLGVRAIYRSNHHNFRFGYHCADDRFQDMLKSMDWEWWDNTRLSEDTWQTQCGDGFHFDRWERHSERQHQEHREAELQRGKETPGMLEMQLAQSLLHRLFRDTLQDILDQRVTRPLTGWHDQVTNATLHHKVAARTRDRR